MEMKLENAQFNKRFRLAFKNDMNYDAGMKLPQWRRACGLWITALCCLTSARAASEISV